MFWCAMFQSPQRMISRPHARSFARCGRKDAWNRNFDACRCGPLEPDGRFRFASSYGGRHELRVQEVPAGTLLARIEGLELAPGLECSDPRLSAIELSVTPPK